MVQSIDVSPQAPKYEVDDAEDKDALVMQAMEEFAGIDADDNGLISADELKQWWVPPLSKAAAIEAIREADEWKMGL